MQWVRRSVYRVWIVGHAISAVDPITWQGFVLLWVLVLSIFRVDTVLHHFQTIESAFIMVRIWKKPFFRATYLSGFIQKRAKNWKNPENESTLRTKTCIIKKIKKKGKVYLRVYKDAQNMDFCKNDVFCHQTTLGSTLFCFFEKL